MCYQYISICEYMCPHLVLIVAGRDVPLAGRVADWGLGPQDPPCGTVTHIPKAMIKMYP